MVNLHFSLLPRWRGAAPVERAILAGDDETGVCLMELEEGLDTGPVYACERVAIGPDETLDELRARLVERGHRPAPAVAARRPGRAGAPGGRGDLRGQARSGRAAARLDPAGGRAAPGRAARAGVDDVPRGAGCGCCGPAWSTAASGGAGGARRPVVAAGEGALELVEVQPEGKRPMAASAWLAGARPQPGERLG